MATTYSNYTIYAYRFLYLSAPYSLSPPFFPFLILNFLVYKLQIHRAFPFSRYTQMQYKLSSLYFIFSLISIRMKVEKLVGKQSNEGIIFNHIQSQNQRLNELNEIRIESKLSNNESNQMNMLQPIIQLFHGINEEKE